MPNPLPLTEAELAEYTGTYDSFTGVPHVVITGDHLVGTLEVNQEMLAEFGEDSEAEETVPALPFRILPDNQFLVIDGAYKGVRGGILRGDDGRVSGLDVGRVFTKRE